MDLSLDEIIKTKKIGVKPTTKTIQRGGFISKRTIKPNFGTQTHARVTDARNKIIEKTRAKIRDAREMLGQIARTSGDARQKLNQKLSLRRQHAPLTTKSKLNRRLPLALAAPARLPAMIKIPRGYVDYDNMEELEEEEFQSSSLRRTVKNDIAPPFVPSYSADRHKDWAAPADPFDMYQIPLRSSALSMDVDLDIPIRRQIRNVPRDDLSPERLPPPPKGILRSNRRPSPPPYGVASRAYSSELPSHLSYEMRSRLERAPDPHASSGIFSNPLKPQSSSSSTGHRIVVSNLHSSVSQSDIKELFEDIGELYDARLVRPGVAEVVYKHLKDAEKAVENYHNRQLDGQPMKCLLVNPRSSNKPTASAIKTTNNTTSSRSSASGKTPLEIDIDALHKVLFRRH